MPQPKGHAKTTFFNMSELETFSVEGQLKLSNFLKVAYSTLMKSRDAENAP